MMDKQKVVVVGLGYVGLPLAVAMAKTAECWGLDIDKQRIEQLRRGHDRTAEIEPIRLNESTLKLTCEAGECPPADFYIVTVPTPVDSRNRPDLDVVMAATRTVGAMLDPSRRPIVVFESTVYPGVTEELCGPELERVSGLKCGEHFFLAYSPERINPGDREHTIDRITKVVSGQTPEVLDKVAKLYDGVTSGGTFRAASIKAAEAAKVIENAQRDINIAFMNEISSIFEQIGLSIWDVLAAANTKWNFLPFKPGLVGGHCIGVDPYYLSHRALQLGIRPDVILSGRRINDDMADRIADSIHRCAGKPGKILVLGLAFKENVPDLRNSKVADLIASLRKRGHDVTVHDPLVDTREAAHEYGIDLKANAFNDRYDVVILAVPHKEYLQRGRVAMDSLLNPGGLFADLKNAFDGAPPTSDVRTWTL